MATLKFKREHSYIKNVPWEQGMPRVFSSQKPSEGFDPKTGEPAPGEIEHWSHAEQIVSEFVSDDGSLSVSIEHEFGVERPETIEVSVDWPR